MKYSVGQKVKIISMDKVRSCPYEYDDPIVGELYWYGGMDKFAGTVQVISHYRGEGYVLVSSNYTFSPEMIEGPADPVEQEGEEFMVDLPEPAGNFILSQKDIKGQPMSTGYFYEYQQVCNLLNRYKKLLQEGEGQEELWRGIGSEVTGMTVDQQIKYLTDKYTITRKK